MGLIHQENGVDQVVALAQDWRAGALLLGVLVVLFIMGLAADR